MLQYAEMTVPEQKRSAVDFDATSIAIARSVMDAEARAIQTAATRIDSSLPSVVASILNHPGKLIVTGIGKSGHVGRRLAATLQSTGTPAVFLHSSEAAHGDLGIYQPGDSILMISNSGTTAELLHLAEAFRGLCAPESGCLIGILGSIASPLAKLMTAVLDASVPREADPEGFVPSCSAAVASALGDALAVALMHARGFRSADFARLHGSGQLGRTLRVRVQDVMHQGEEVAWVSPQDSLKSVVLAMSRRPLGAACVVSDSGTLVGLVTDGDVRRAFEAHDDIRTLEAGGVMTKSPLTVAPEVLLNQALLLMEDRPSQISVLPVVDETGRCLGLLRLHDIYQAESKAV
jgi:arabinose-5-phosphate isomerase